MAMMIDAKKLRTYKENNPDRIIICYVNSYAEVKALSDVCVTSSNAEKIVRQFADKKLLYVPDKNLGLHLKDKFDLDMDIWPGYCSVHDRLKPEDVTKARKEHPEALVLVHPEAPLAVLKMADYVGSTRGIIDFATKSDSGEFVIGTERGILYPLQKANPDKKFFLLSENLTCRNMKLTALEDVYNALENEEFEIKLDPELIRQARKPLDLMLEMS